MSSRTGAPSLPLSTFIPLAVLLAAWQLLARIDPQSVFFFSSPVGIAHALWSAASSGRMFIDAGVTLFEALTGFLLGTVTGLILGLSLWYWPKAAGLSRPYLTAISAIPPFAIAPVMIVWFGIGIFAKVMVAWLATLFVATVQTYEGARSANERHLRLVRILGGNRTHEFTKVVVPTALVWVVNSMRLNIGLALTGAFVGEFISAERGLGYAIVRAAALYDMANVLAGCLVLMLVALACNAAIDRLESRLIRHRS